MLAKHHVGLHQLAGEHLCASMLQLSTVQMRLLGL